MTISKDTLNQAWHAMPAENILRDLETSVDGLSTSEAQSRLDKFGLNRIAEEEKTPVLITIVHQFANPIIYILLISGIVTIILRDFLDAAVIFAVVVLNAIIGFTQEYKAEESIRSLKKLLAIRTFIIRDGVEQEIGAELIVPGDIVSLQSGQKVPADVRLMHVKEFQVDESAFTGESVPVLKTDKQIPDPNITVFEQNNMAFMGSVVTSGRAAGIVIATGPSTQLGQISEDVRSVGPITTPLQKRMSTLSHYIIVITALFGLVGFIVGTLREENILQLVLAIIAMAVAVVPEGLPIALTIALAVAVSRMAKQNAIIRHLPAIETLGSSTVIGSDKTGTLTRNEMTVEKIWAAVNTYIVKGPGYEPTGEILIDSEPVNVSEYPELQQVLRIGLLANESELIKEDGRWQARGDPTEVALIVSARRAGIDEEKEKEAYQELDMIPFESEFQYMATLNKHNGKVYLLVKGAPEKLLALSKTVAGMIDDVKEHKSVAINKANEFADKGLRVLGMAYKEMEPSRNEVTHNDVRDLTFIGLQGMMDPPRTEAIEAVKSARLSGIRVIMITGDNARTALSISKIMGIAEEDSIAKTGRELDEMSNHDLEQIVQNTSVFARVSPYHKLRIVNALKSTGEVVAVTGDGVNDAAALKAAHIGVAMGITGTDVAKEASDMVVLDDNFASIYAAIIEGRVAFDNIRKVTFFLLTTGAGVLIAIFATIVTELPLIMLPAQILWVNLVTNGLQDVALAFDPKDPGVEKRTPRRPGEGVLSRDLIIRLAVMGSIIAVATLGILIAGLSVGAPLDHVRTMALTTIVFAQFFNLFITRSEKISVFRQSITNNRFLFLSMVLAVIAQMLLLYLPVLRYVFSTTALSATELIIVIAVAGTVLIGGELDKWRVGLSR